VKVVEKKNNMSEACTNQSSAPGILNQNQFTKSKEVCQNIRHMQRNKTEMLQSQIQMKVLRLLKQIRSSVKPKRK